MRDKTLLIVLLLPCILGAQQLSEYAGNLKQQNIIENTQQETGFDDSPALGQMIEQITTWPEILVDQEVKSDLEKANLQSSCQVNRPVVEQIKEDNNDYNFYGYRFWMRFLTAYPERLLNGKNAPWYFIARLTSNFNYQNVDMGDRLLAVWQGQGFYHFTTCDQPTNQANLIQNINYPEDIEGLWTYVSYAYSSVSKKAIAFIKYGDIDQKQIVHQVTHPLTKKLKFLLGGTDNQQYPGFNGLFSNVEFSTSQEIYIESLEKFNELLQKQISPKQDLIQLQNHEIVKEQLSRTSTDKPIYHEVITENFPHEYSISGWFLWEEMQQQQVWHNIFRVQINKQQTDKFLGDRTLSSWIGTADGGIIHFPTYSYTSMNGEGHPNLVNNIPHKNRINNWFFVYFGYSKNEKKGFVGVRFTTGIETLEYNNVNHYFASTFYIYVGKDMHFPGFNGKIGFINFNIGDGAFKKMPDFKHPNDIFGLLKGEENILKNPVSKADVKPENKETSTQKINVDQTSYVIKSLEDSPKVDKTNLPVESNLIEYGYGFWLRFFTAYPERLLLGKNQQWYFVSRLTLNNDYENARMGDRGLAIWLGQGYYHFTTCNTHNNQVNVIQNIDYPEDIEGLWTFVYYSYHAQEENARGMIKFGSSPIQSISHNVLHPTTKQVRLIVGGTDNKRYPGYNGIIAKIYFSYEKGAFINSIQQLQEFIDLNSQVPETQPIELINTPVIKAVATRDPPDSPVVVEVTEKRLVNQYAISGWFQWKPTEFQKIWHNVFRVQIKTPSTDAYLGDRTLTCWIGTIEGGVLHFPTYSYVNMNGGGNNNFYKNIQHKDRIKNWFFIYFGYSKDLKKASVFVKWTDSSDKLDYDNINHYYAPTFYIYGGKDQFFSGFSGKISQLNFNIGEGSFRPNQQFDHPLDVFGYNYGLKEYHKQGSVEVKQPEVETKVEEKIEEKKPEIKPVMESESETEIEIIYSNGESQNQPIFEKELEQQEEFQSYGYGFWLRFLTQYPDKLLKGKAAPWYFISRLTWNKQYDNLNMGDRALAIWQGQGFYHFTTCNTENQQSNVIENVNFPEDIEGVWTYIHFSYSFSDSQAVGFIKYGNEEPKQIIQKVQHQKQKYIKLIVGGNDQNRYPGFNGQFKNIKFSINTKPDYLIPQPQQGFTEFKRNKLIEQPIERQSDDDITKYTKLCEKDQMFPIEYGISGWYQWKPTAQQTWHNAFRVQIKEPSTDAFLGDRTLSMWVSTIEGGILHFSTYTYTNMNGEGNTNQYKNIQHKNRHLKWFFTYFGYSKKLSRAVVFVKWNDSDDFLIFENTKHFLAPEFHVYIGKDKQFIGFNGQIAQVNFNIGEGSYIENKNFDIPEDPYSFKFVPDYQDTKSEEQNEKIEPQQIKFETQEEEFESSFENEKPVLEKEFVQETIFQKYGYGFWLRFMHLYPKRLLSGKNAPWYFVSRLTSNKQYDNINMGDRLLAVWLGQGFYHFATCDTQKNQPNVVQNIDYPTDIEGLWTYIYYSYENGRAAAFIRYSNDDIKTIQHEVTHAETKFLKLIIGGNDKNRYPGFNGFFQKIVFSAGHENLIETKEQFILQMNSLPKPKTGLQEQITYQLVKEEITRTQNDDPICDAIGKPKERFPSEYSISGWFKWTETQVNVWHNLFRVQIKQPSTDVYLGDRTFGLWLGQIDGGVLHFPTYTYTDMNGKGNPNYYKNIKHNNRHFEWFYVYFGYSKTLSKSYALVSWTDGVEDLIYETVNHYYTPEFFLFIGRDKFFPGHNGQMAYVFFDIGNGSYKTNNEVIDTTESFLRGRITIKRTLTIKTQAINKQIPIQPEPIQKQPQTDNQSDTPILNREPKQVEKSKSDYDTPQDQQKVIVPSSKEQPENKQPQQTDEPQIPIPKVPQVQKAQDPVPQQPQPVQQPAQQQPSDAAQKTQQPETQQPQPIQPNQKPQVQGNQQPQIQPVQQPQVQPGQQSQVQPIQQNQQPQDQPTQQPQVQPNSQPQIQPNQQPQGQPQPQQPQVQPVQQNQQSQPQGQPNQQAQPIQQPQVQPNQQPQAIPNQQPQVQQIRPQDQPIQPTQSQQPVPKPDIPQTEQLGQPSQQTDPLKQPSTQGGQQPVKPDIQPIQQTQPLDGPVQQPQPQPIQQPGQIQQPEPQPIQQPQPQTSDKKTDAQPIQQPQDPQQKQPEQPNSQIPQQPQNQPLQQPNDQQKEQPQQKQPAQEPQQNPTTSEQPQDLVCSPLKDEPDYQIIDHNNQSEDTLPTIEMPASTEDLTNYDQDDPIPYKEVKIIPGQTLEDELINNEDSTKSIADQGITVTSNLQEYGYGYWFRFLTYYPKQLLNGKSDPWYFMTRLTRNKNYDNIEMGDRTLAIWQGAGYYHFTTYDLEGQRPNVLMNVEYPNDIEGLWTYVYYSYSVEQELAVAHIKFGQNDFKTIKLNAKHAPSVYLRFILGGTDQGRYPAFNGIFKKVTFGIKTGTFIPTAEQLMIKADLHSVMQTTEELKTFKLIENELIRNQDTNFEFKAIKNIKTQFPSEYSISGWFKWSPSLINDWHNLFRVQIKKQSTDSYLGDRTLSCWMGKIQGGVYQFPTYTYTNMIGNGNPNLYKNIPLQGRNTKWHYIYFGYSKITSQAYAYVKWIESEDELNYENVNHYYIQKLYIYIGKDMFYPGFNGKLNYVVVNFGLGAFRNKKKFNDNNDIFNYDIGTKQLFKANEERQFKPFIRQEKIVASTDQFEQEEIGERAFTEYGYGFWMRFLTLYPGKLQNGIESKSYFISRLTWNKNYGDTNLGDRALGVWQGKGFYQFSTCNILTKNGDQFQNINYPNDIEGVWTFIYYSYDKEESKAVGFVRFGSDKNIQQITHQTIHSDIKYLKLVVGGNDNKRYSGFNGQFQKISFQTQSGAFIDQAIVLKSQYLEKNEPQLITVNVINEQVNRKQEDKPTVVETEKVQITKEYAISGWFKCENSDKKIPSQNFFKVKIGYPEKTVVDNTLSAFFNEQMLQFTTYTYENMQGTVKDQSRTVEHKNRHFRWFFIYFGYQKEKQTAHIHVQWQEEMAQQGFANTNHYLTNQFFIHIGGDDQTPGFVGSVSQIRFNIGEGAFKQVTDYKDAKNSFGFDLQTVKQDIKQFDFANSKEKEIITTSFESESKYLKVFNKQDLEDVIEYGYGFWIRFLRNFPNTLINGLKVDWSFVGRLSKNNELQDITLGDRALAIWLGKGFYHFTTYNDNNANIFNNVNHPADLEGLWTFIHYSHSLNKQRSDAFIIFGSDKPIQSTLLCTHTVPQLLKFYLGGSQLQYKGFNGQIASAYVGVNKGIYVDSISKLEDILKIISKPLPYRSELKVNSVVERLHRFEANSQGKQITFDDQQFSGEYAWSGWFKWSGTYQNLWHLVIRLSTLENAENMSNLGDRTLCLWIGQQAGGILYFSTYTYNDIYGSGIPNSVQNVQYRDDLNKWQFVYFGYSKPRSLAYAKVEFASRGEEINFRDHHHYLPNKFYLSVGKDKYHDAYQGNMAFLKFVTGDGAFYTGDFQGVKDDIFAHKLGSMELLKPKSVFDVTKESITKIFSSPQINQQEPIFSKIYDVEDLENVQEYGYGFWCRFLTHYPTLLQNGLQVDWSFISRLTKNKDKGDLNVGDRTLAIWLGKGFYHFTTYSHKYANVIKNIDHPEDIEGLWTFVYFSHNLYKKESVAIIKFGNDKMQSQTIPAIHQTPTFLQLFIGGNNQKYPAYNGQFAGIIFSISEGVFKTEESDIDKMLQTLRKPNDFTLKLHTKEMIAKPKQTFAAQENVFDDIQLVGEYSYSGWFKWKAVGEQQPWYLMVRLAIMKSTSDMTLLGDRTLMTFMGQGYIHFTTYTMKNIKGEGTPNIWQNINHDGEHIQWHYVYFGYSKAQKLAYAQVIFDDRPESVSFKDTNHYLPSLFALTIGKDKWFNAYSGDIAYFRFHAGEGAFQTSNFDKDKNDMFAYKIGSLTAVNPNKPPPEEMRSQEVLDSSISGEPIFSFEISKELYESSLTTTTNEIPVITDVKTEVEELKEQIISSEKEKFKDEQGVGMGEQHYQFPDRIKSDEPVDPHKEKEVEIQQSKVEQVNKQPEHPQSDWQGLSNYGYGFYMRYLTMYPQPMQGGKVAPFYFISRLTWNPQPQDILMGDRVLAIFQGQGAYSFHTLDKPSNNPNLRTLIPYADIEGVWTFVYFSYSKDEKKAVVFLKYDDNTEIMRRDIPCYHGEVEYLKLQIGGKQTIYPGFNGQIANYAFKYGTKSAYVNDIDLFKRVLKSRVPHPGPDDNTLKQFNVADQITAFKGDDTTEDIKEVSESHFQGEYAVSGWLRWDQPIGQPFFSVFRLSAVKMEDNTDSKLGDRELMLFKHNVYYLFSSYNYQNLNGGGDTNINWQVNHQEQEQFWHFFYLGYKRETKQLYYYVSFIDDEFDQNYNNIRHFVVNKHYLQFGRDFKKFQNSFRGFTGSATHVKLSYGNGSFQKKPLKQDIDVFMFATGHKELFSSLELHTQQSEKNKLLIGDAAKQIPVLDIELTDNVRGLNEYGWALWCRWSRTLNKPIPIRDAWYSIARLVNRKNHQDLAVEGDRTLASWVGMGFYVFSTYSKGVLQVVDSIPYQKLEGQWNFIVFSYQKNVARASVLFGKEQQIVDKEFKVKHNLIKDYLRFYIGAEFSYKAFNGHFTNIQLRLGIGAHLSREEILVIASGELQLPSEAKYDQTRKTIEIVKDRVPGGGTGREFEIKETEGKEEYSISGWAKWIDMPSIGPWYVLYKVTYYDYGELTNPNIPGSKVFSCHKAYGFYHFNTYTADMENGGIWSVVKNVDYDMTLHRNWVYFYQGYSHSKQQVHLYVKFPGQEEHFTFTSINHFIPQTFRVHFLLDRWSPAFNGYIENWFFNAGQGSYKENGYGIGENELTNFGFGLHKSPQPKNFNFDEVYPCSFNQQNVGQEVEYKDDIDGIVEYGYGMWTRFAWNTPIKMIDKPAAMALSRLTVNPNHQGDAAQLGDRALAIWIGEGFYHFTTSTRDNYNVVSNLQYEQGLDGQWNYVWFGYKRVNQQQGMAAGFVVYDGIFVRRTNFGNILQQPLNDYLYLAVGSSGKQLLNRYFQFNGHIARVSLILGSGGYVDKESDLRNILPPKPEFLRNLKQFSKLVQDEVKIMKRGETVPAPVEFGTEFDGAIEYSVSIWFKWTKIDRVAWESIFSLSYHEPQFRANHAKPGDRVLSMFQYADHRIFFSTYSTPTTHDQFAQLYTECPVDIPSQSEWVYGYYGYSRNKLEVLSYLQTKTNKCLKKLPCMHRVPKYMGLYVGKDGIHTPYNGKFSKLYILGHLGSYVDSAFETFEPFAVGGIAIQKPAYLWSESKEPFEIAFDQNKVIELKPEEVDEQSSYSIGMWTKYYTAIPKRLLQKPDWLHIARLTINKDHKNYQNLGDRTLSLFLGRGYYGFFTYNAYNNNANIAQTIPYGAQLEGVWNFIYFSYSAQQQTATGFVKFSDSEKRVQFRDLQHKPIDNYAKLVLGAEFLYKGFNGIIANLQIGFGQRYYVPDVDGLNKIIAEIYTRPLDAETASVKLPIQEELKDREFNAPPDYKEITDQKGVTEYAMYGWFRYTSAAPKTPNNCIMRLTNNEQAYRGEINSVGDRTLLVMLQPGEYVFATYSIGLVDSGAIINIRKPTPYKSKLGLWTYIYFGYSFQLKKASGIIKYPSEYALIPYTNVVHMVPNYLLFFFGGDGMLGGWQGQMQKVNLLFGKNSFVDSTKGNFEERLPNLQGPEQKPIVWDGIDNQIIEVPLPDKPAIDLIFNKDVTGFSEYGYGLWTRWLTTIPNRVVEKAPYHQLIRLCSTQNYEDAISLGNRVLAVWVGKGFYHFTTYNKIGNKVSISQNIDYGDNLEGQWNYIYYSFTSKGEQRAVAFTYFSELQGTAISRIEFQNLDHIPLNGYARVVAVSKEFGYQPFNGMIADLQVHLGNGFIGSKEQLIKEILQINPKPPIDIKLKTTQNIIQAETPINPEEKKQMQSKYDQFKGVIEYAVSGWVQAKVMGYTEAYKNVFRLTINQPELQRDKQYAGDRTLALFLSKTKYAFSTYTYGKLDTNDDDSNEYNRVINAGNSIGEWVFVYFGYNLKLKQAFAFTLFEHSQDSALFSNIKHFVPNQFWFYLTNDGFYPIFDGNLFDINLHFGEGSYTTKPRLMINSWPVEPQVEPEAVFSALLSNQGLNSLKIIRAEKKEIIEPKSGAFDLTGQPSQPQPLSAKIPQSGNIIQPIQPKSGEMSITQQPQSGEVK